ncbi:hypothetical protein LZQ00_13380 [Sphingobacterium sp. SRCM116780]|uniref:hypothetical protein n=1 Tax=Sphingobacterium sp. SRCM116780 TaxID=2907623 RepID=UPI001F3E2D53|nr:hypothetical protein [Sphingobacterium sp. SRCM116780]UIR55259.1 hypothetical protein LZQ00_13380 [Sphingobacterium sp. SRCM116780]
MSLKKESIYNLIKIFLFFSFLTWLIYFIFTKKTVLNALNIGFSNQVESEYEGIIQKKYVDHDNHNSTMVAFTHRNAIGINGEFWGQMEEGDSISKVKGDSVIQVFRGDKKILIEIAPFYREAIQKEIDKRKSK